MKNIKGHKSRNQSEIIEILASGRNYCCPILTHYRYDRVKSACNDLIKYGLAKKTGETKTGINLMQTEIMTEWQHEFLNGTTPLNPVKWVKEKRKNKENIT